MKKNLFKKLFNLSWLILAAMLMFTACSDDDDDPIVVVLDGTYISGTATGLTGLDASAMMMDGREEGDGFSSDLRTGMYESFIYLVAGDFNIVVKAGVLETTYGVAAGTAGVLNSDGGDEITAAVDTGEIAVDGEAFTITTAGLYHVVMDVTTLTYFVIPVTSWAVIGDATDLGWSGEFAMTQTSLTATAGEWEITDLTLRETGGFKFRYDGGWKLTTNDFIIFANVGDDPDSEDFMMGGGTFPYPTAGEGAYTVTLTWSLTDGFAFTTERTGDVDPLPEYHEALYMIGDGVGDWDWANTILPMVATHTHPELFWKIVWINATGAFKFSPVLDWNGDFGVTGTATDGVYAIGSDNIAVPGTAGYYMVVVDLENNTVEVNAPKVYGIGAAFSDNWDPGELFTVDNANEVIKYDNLPTGGELRMYVAATTLACDWWQSEFMILSDVIEFRADGDDQARVTVTAGQNVSLNFKDLTGSIQ